MSTEKALHENETSLCTYDQNIAIISWSQLNCYPSIQVSKSCCIDKCMAVQCVAWNWLLTEDLSI